MQNPDIPQDAERRVRRRRLRIVALAVVTVALFVLIFVQAAFNTLQWLRPSSVSETFSLYALSTINFLAFVVLLMVLVRNIIKLRRERRQQKLGARFKTRIVIFFIALSTLPVTFLFFATTGFINRSMDKWFSLPGNEMLTNAYQIQKAYVEGERAGLNRTALTIARLIARTDAARVSAALDRETKDQDLILARFYDREGRLVAQSARPDAAKFGGDVRTALESAREKASAGAAFDSQQINDAGKKVIYLIAATPVAAQAEASENPERRGALVIAQQIPENLVGSVSRIRELSDYYETLKENQKLYRRTSLQTQALITLLVLFIAFWLAIYVARSLTDPVRQLAEATERIRRGDLSYRAVVVGDDELAALAISFNEMTVELGDNRQRLDERRHYIETILQSLSAGVISLDENANVTTINDAARQLLRIEEHPASGTALASLLPEEQREELRRMIARATRLRSVTRDVHFTLANQAKLDAAVTVSALHDPSGASRGAVIVIEDLTELIEAQRRAAWSEVARRMAHEIKNPLTPIRLSAERLAKNLLGDANGAAKRLDCLNDRQENLVRECTGMIGAEVATLQRMVDEFSNFARLPKAAFESASLNEVVESAIKLYDERLEGIRLERQLAAALSPVMIDAEQIKRVLVNLIDNAAEALAAVTGGQNERRITIGTRENTDRDVIELSVADTGPGIPAEDRERVFDPYFSTRKRGTGLGLAIVSRIVAEHQGRIRVQGNAPRGTRFIVELPLST